jgi:hypothetical protein
MSSREMRMMGVRARWGVGARPADEAETRGAGVVVEDHQVEVLAVAGVGEGVAVRRAGADVPAGELQHVLDGLEEHLVLLVVEDNCGAGGHR